MVLGAGLAESASEPGPNKSAQSNSMKSPLHTGLFTLKAFFLDPEYNPLVMLPYTTVKEAASLILDFPF